MGLPQIVSFKDNKETREAKKRERKHATLAGEDDAGIKISCLKHHFQFGFGVRIRAHTASSDVECCRNSN